ncbi:NBR1-Ig-like domain-containing protein [Actinocorallia longicatena]
MSGRSGAISHTTLHEATKGNRLPSWETTVEFVRACGGEPGEFRERWEAANRAVRTAGAADPAARPAAAATASATGTGERRAVHLAIEPRTGAAGTTGPAPVPVPPPGGGGVPPARPAVGVRSRRSRPVVGVLAAAAIGVGAVIVFVAVDRGSEPGKQTPTASATGPASAAAGCPVVFPNPPPAPPEHEGDAAVFVRDVTLGDCTHVDAGRTVTKTWQIKNIGTVPWKGYRLRRIDSPQQADQCQTISHVPIRDTPPGGTVDISTEVTTPVKPGLCVARFKMVDAAGRFTFPGNRAINFQLYVDGA